MRRNQKVKYRSERKRTGKKVVVMLAILGVIIAAAVTWVGLNDWDVRKSASKIGVTLGMIDDKKSEVGNKKTDDELHEAGGAEGEQKEDESPPKEEITKDSGGYIEGMELPEEPTYVDGILIANKEYPLPANYAPGEDVEAREAFGEMAAEAALSNFDLTAFSTYRSFEYQEELYERYVTRDGKEAADRYSARPGYSEHQTGLAFDIGEVNYEQYWASSEFGETEAGKWLAENAHRFGFILRYPLGKEELTGYMHESWHFRYVGTEIAKEIYEKNITLEEYVGLK